MAKKQKYKQTQELLRIALKAGLTQTEAAKLCRTQQSQVSKWKNGEALANVDQVKPLLDRYGYLLKQGPFKIYQFVKDNGELAFLKVEGKLLLREKFRSFASPGCGNSSKQKSCIRVTIHCHGEGRYSVVFEATTSPAPSKSTEHVLTFNDRHAEWRALPLDEQNIRTISADELVAFVSTLHHLSKHEEWWQHFQGLQALPLLTVEALSRQGVILEKVETFKL